MNISWLHTAAAVLIVGAMASACTDDKSEPANLVNPYPPSSDKPVAETSPAGYTLGEQSTVFGFTAQNRYSYCPSALAMPNGSVEIYFCGNPTPDVMVDNVYHITSMPDGSHSSAISVLQPGQPGTWDSHHTCDPAVIKGKFRMGGNEYTYAMFYLGCSLEYYYNEVGVAFSNSLDSRTWDKYPLQIVTKGWDTAGDLEYAPGAKCWGTGQPSAVSLDKAGKVLLTYTLGNLYGTRLMARELDFSNMDSPVISEAVTVPSQGLTSSTGNGTDYICNADIAIEPQTGQLVMIRPVQPHPATYPAFINATLEICTMPLADFRRGFGVWNPLYRIEPRHTGYPRNHNACLERDVYGHLADVENIRFYYTISEEEPDVAPRQGQFAEWSYTIRKGEIARTH